MKRDKKNTLISAEGPMLNKNRSDSADVIGKATVPSIDAPEKKMPTEINGPKGPEPTRYGDWEQKGRCTDF